jgi:hypothetical protein
MSKKDAIFLEVDDIPLRKAWIYIHSLTHIYIRICTHAVHTHTYTHTHTHIHTHTYIYTQEVLKEKKLVTYYSELYIGGKPFRILMDTGSSEFWVPSTECGE